MAEIPSSIQTIADVVNLAVQDFKEKKSYAQIGGDLFGKFSELLKAEGALSADVAKFGLYASIGVGVGLILDGTLKKAASAAVEAVEHAVQG